MLPMLKQLQSYITAAVTVMLVGILGFIIDYITIRLMAEMRAAKGNSDND